MNESNAATPIGEVVDGYFAIGEVVDGYFAMWNETDPARRREVIEATWSEDASYVDPMFAAEGPDALDEMVAGVHEQFPGHHFRQIGAIDAHNDRARWGWKLVGPADGPPVAVGVDFAVLAPDGRLREVSGFLEQQTGAA